MFGRLSDRVYFSTSAFDRDQSGRRGEVAIPNIVVDTLEMPDALSCLCIQRDQAVGEQIVAYAISAVLLIGALLLTLRTYFRTRAQLRRMQTESDVPSV